MSIADIAEACATRLAQGPSPDDVEAAIRKAAAPLVRELRQVAESRHELCLSSLNGDLVQQHDEEEFAKCTALECEDVRELLEEWE